MTRPERDALTRRNFQFLGFPSAIGSVGFAYWQDSTGAGVWMFLVMWIASFLATEAVNGIGDGK